ncbi:MAG: glycosyltransferase family 2 protein [Bacteroidota bacterium]
MSKSSNYEPFFSIITVVFNAEEYIERTIKSVVEQNYFDYEYIIVDGGSSDQTLSIISKYKEKIDVLVSQRDKGIYDAMNKGVLLAKGKYINFMNAGDTFYNKHILYEVYYSITQANNRQKVDIIYGKVVNISSEKPNFRYEAGKPVTKYSFYLSMPMCHQTMFTRRDVFKTVGLFPLEREMGAFYEWLSIYYTQKKSLSGILFLPRRIAFYLLGGHSFRAMKAASRERLLTAKKYFSLEYQVYNYIRHIVTLLKVSGLALLTRYHLLDKYRRAKYRLLNRGV